MSWELSKEVVDWAQVLGAGLSLLALVLALYALTRTRSDLARERRRAHELQILRDIGEQFSLFLQAQWRPVVNGEGAALVSTQRRALPLDEHSLLLRSRLLMPPSGDFPMTRASLGMTVEPEIKTAFEGALRLFLNEIADDYDVALEEDVRNEWVSREMKLPGARDYSLSVIAMTRNARAEYAAASFGMN